MGYRSLNCHKCIYYFGGFCESRNSGKYFVEGLYRCEQFKKNEEWLQRYYQE